MSRYTSPEGFWFDLAHVSEAMRSNGQPDVAVVRRMAEHDAEFDGVARRGVDSVGMGALLPVLAVPEASAGPPVSRRPFVDALARSVAAVDMPPAGMTFQVPTAVTAGITTSTMATENASVTESVPNFTALSMNLLTIAARVSLSRQAFERGASSGALTRQIRDKLDSHVEAAVINTLIASSSFVSLSATFGWDAVKATQNASGNVGEAMQAMAEVVVMHPRRLAHWGAAAVSSTNLPVSFDRPSVGGVPIVPSGGMPTAASGSTNQDRITVTRWDALVWSEDSPRVSVVVGGGSPSPGVGTVQIIASQYVAFAPRGYASAIQSVSGAGLGPPSYA